jgi:hypothetical protein
LPDFLVKQDHPKKIKPKFIINAKFMTHSKSNQVQWNKI